MTPRAPLLKRLGWMLALWSASVAALGLISWVVGWWLRDN
jgi:hypothetical protein